MLLSRWKAHLVIGALGMPMTTLAVKPAAPVASTENKQDAEVRALLGAYEKIPGKDAWRAMKGDVIGSLTRLASDRKQPLTVRVRACEVLGWLDPAQSVPFLKGVLAKASQPEALRAGALVGLSHAQNTKEALRTLTQGLADAQALVRYRSAVEIRRLGLARPAAEALRQRAAVEQDGSVSRALAEAIKSVAETKSATGK